MKRRGRVPVTVVVVKEVVSERQEAGPPEGVADSTQEVNVDVKVVAGMVVVSVRKVVVVDWRVSVIWL